MNLEQIKKAAVIFILCAAAAVALQLVFPIVLGVFVNGLPFVGAFLLYDFLSRKKWKTCLSWEKEKRNEEVGTNTEMPDSEEKKIERAKCPDSQEPEREKCRKETGKRKMEDVSLWYQETGRERIRNIILELDARGIHEFWIQERGHYNIRTERGYRRAGCIAKLPKDALEELVKELAKDGMSAAVKGRYLHIGWQR